MKRLAQWLTLQVPQSNRTVITARGNRLAIGAKRYKPNLRCLPMKRLTQWLTLQVPQLYRPLI